MTTTDPLLADLTDAQRRAVMHRDGALLVLAGPGSGKTTVVTRRIAWLMACGVPSWRILALTFTNKAAREMRQRIELLLAGRSEERPPAVATFHAFCARLLRRYAEAAGISPRYSIYDESDRREAIKRAVAAADLETKNWRPAAIGADISRARNQLLDAAAFTASATGYYDRQVARIYREYEKILKANNALDFDDLLLRTAKLLRDDEGVRRELQRRYHYLLVDEYQDTNHAQFVIAHTLAAAHGNICVVGDPDQSIYGWRGADISNILEFEEHYPDALVVPLGQNFRSTGHIVAASAALIGCNRRRKHKRLFTELDEGDRPTAVVCGDEHHEARLVADFLRRERDEADVPWREMAVLYRVNAQSRVLEEALRNARVPYVIARGTAFYDRKEIRDALAYLRLIVNPDDEVSLRRIVNTPPRGIGRTTLDKIEVFAGHHQLTLFPALTRAARGQGPELPARAAGAVRRFVELVEDFVRAAEAGAPADLPALVEDVVRRSGLEAMYAQRSEEDRQRRENLAELISAAAQFQPVVAETDDEPHDATLTGALGRFLESVALVSDQDLIDAEGGTVTLMTLHAAKGLEFMAVALVGLEEGLLPHATAATGDAGLEEERRLCYVGMTRARRRLLLTRAAVRTHRGVRARTVESTFLRELPHDAVIVSDQAGAGSIEPVEEEPPADFGQRFPVGAVVRHPRFGLGLVEAVERRRRGAAARVTFPAGTKTLLLEHAGLTRVR